MATEIPNFDKAEFLDAVPAANVPEAPFVSSSFQGSAWQDRDEDRGFVQALLFGVGAAVAGSLLYAAFTLITHIQIGYAGIVIGYMVGNAMMKAAGGMGGRRYQIAASILTYLSVAMSVVPLVLWELERGGKDTSRISLHGLGRLCLYGVASPFLDLRDGVNGLIGLLILIFAIRTAWKLTADKSVAA